MVSTIEHLQDTHSSTHSTIQCKCILRIFEGCQVPFEGQSSGITTSGIVKTHWLAWRRLGVGAWEINGRGYSSELGLEGVITTVNSLGGETTNYC
jgi:hypothetical protein